MKEMILVKLTTLKFITNELINLQEKSLIKYNK
jgi:hypothetical protein